MSYSKAVVKESFNQVREIAGDFREQNKSLFDSYLEEVKRNAQERHEFLKSIEQLKRDHALEKQKQDMVHSAEIEEIKKNHRDEIEAIKIYWEANIRDVHEKDINSMKKIKNILKILKLTSKRWHGESHK